MLDVLKKEFINCDKSHTIVFSLVEAIVVIWHFLGNTWVRNVAGLGWRFKKNMDQFRINIFEQTNTAHA